MEPQMYILKNENLEVHLSDYGATITRMITRDNKGKEVDILLGLENVKDYALPAYQASGAYLGAIIGRYANRIAGGQFEIDGVEYHLAVNNGPNHLHGGLSGFDKKNWKVADHTDTHISMFYDSACGEENYPGTLAVRVDFVLENKELKITYHALSGRKCYVNLTHHPYFNLNPEKKHIGDLKLKLYTDRYLKTDEDLIPDGTFVQAADGYNFTEFCSLRENIDKYGGLDDCYIFDNNGKVKKLAELICEDNGIGLYVCSDYPGLQVYTGRYLDVSGTRGGGHYGAFAGVALEPQFWPDSPHHPEFPSTLLMPDEEYVKTIIYGLV